MCVPLALECEQQRALECSNGAGGVPGTAAPSDGAGPVRVRVWTGGVLQKDWVLHRKVGMLCVDGSVAGPRWLPAEPQLASGAVRKHAPGE